MFLFCLQELVLYLQFGHCLFFPEHTIPWWRRRVTLCFRSNTGVHYISHLPVLGTAVVPIAPFSSPFTYVEGYKHYRRFKQDLSPWGSEFTFNWDWWGPRKPHQGISKVSFVFLFMYLVSPPLILFPTEGKSATKSTQFSANLVTDFFPLTSMRKQKSAPNPWLNQLLQVMSCGYVCRYSAYLSCGTYPQC